MPQYPSAPRGQYPTRPQRPNIPHAASIIGQGMQKVAGIADEYQKNQSETKRLFDELMIKKAEAGRAEQTHTMSIEKNQQDIDSFQNKHNLNVIGTVGKSYLDTWQNITGFAEAGSRQESWKSFLNHLDEQGVEYPKQWKGKWLAKFDEEINNFVQQRQADLEAKSGTASAAAQWIQGTDGVWYQASRKAGDTELKPGMSGGDVVKGYQKPFQIEIGGKQVMVDPISKQVSEIGVSQKDELDKNEAARKWVETNIKQTGADREFSKPVLTPAQKKADEDYAKEHSHFFYKGGIGDAVKGLSELQEVHQALTLGEEQLTGPYIGSVPKFARDLFAVDSANRQDMVEQVVQRNLRLVLGAQFTEREGVRLIARAYNVRLPEKENAERIKRLMSQIETAIKAKTMAGKYFDQNGTLKGFKIQSVINLIDDEPMRKELLKQFRERGLDEGGALAPQQTPDWSNDKEMRYQELKRKQQEGTLK